MNTITKIALILFIVLGNVALAQQSHNHYRSASNLILQESLQATHLAQREFVEKQSNDAIGMVENNNAVSEWQDELKKDPENANLNYKMGLCYYFSYDQQLKALPYFKKAIGNLTANYDFVNDKENKAPYATFYFLADTYLQNNQPDSAIKYFSMYEDDYESVPISTELGVFMSINAKEATKSPRNVNVTSLGNAMNSPYAETNPVIRLDNKLLFFSSRRPGNKSPDTSGTLLYDADIYLSVRNANNMWENALPFKYNTENDEAPLYLSPNGDVLYFRRTAKHNTDIFKTEWKQNEWTKPVPVNEVNTAFNETGISLTADGKQLYFCSDQNKAGKYDIFRLSKQTNGKWGQLELLSSMINNPFNQVSPYISPDGKTLFFSTNGSSKRGMGGYDIFYSELRADSTWSEPNTMGFPINSTRDDINYFVSSEDKRYFSNLTEKSSYDIFVVEGGGFDFESIAAGTEVVTVTNEMGVTQVMETEKTVEKEVEVTQAVETIVEKEKEVEVIKMIEVEKAENKTDPELNFKKDEKPTLNTEKKKLHLSEEQMNLDNLDDESKAAVIDNVKRYLTSELKTNERVVYKTILFDVNKRNLNGLSKTELKLLVDYLKENPQLKVEIVGHTDDTGPWTWNNKLSIKRAETVYNYLLERNIPAMHLHYYGKGSASPFAENSTEEGKAKNRRTEILIVKD